MDILMAEIERKKRQLESSGVVGPNKKYFKRGELEAREKEKKQHDENHSKKEPTVVETSPDEKDGQKDAKEVPKVAPLPRKDVIRKLREREEPILLFGETEYEAYLRLKRLETQEPDVKGEGYSNDFKAAMDQVDQQYLEEIIKSSEGGTSNDVSIKDDGTTLEDIETMRQELGQEDKDRDQEIILRFFKYILKMWGNELNKRAAEEKRSTKGKMESATHTQTVSYLKPLFRKLKRKAVDHDLLESIVEIVKRLMDKDYIKANDSYLEMAIGNAPWPIGVTMVGIHARTGREKISSKYVAHVLNDETQRKYIQAMKRLMTQCQNLFPTDPSRSFNYKKTE